MNPLTKTFLCIIGLVVADYLWNQIFGHYPKMAQMVYFLLIMLCYQVERLREELKNIAYDIERVIRIVGD